MGDQSGKLQVTLQILFYGNVTGESLFTTAASKRNDSPGRKAYRNPIMAHIHCTVFITIHQTIDAS